MGTLADIARAAAQSPATIVPAAIAPAPVVASHHDEKARVSSILDHPSAKGCEGLAKAIAFETSLPVDKAAVLLKASPKAAVAAPVSKIPPVSERSAEIPAGLTIGGNSAGDRVGALGQGRCGGKP